MICVIPFHSGDVSLAQDFMGCVYRSNNPDIPGPVLSGVAVYPNECAETAEKSAKGIAAFDVMLSQMLNGDLAHTDLIQWIWGEKREVAPRFDEVNTPGTE